MRYLFGLKGVTGNRTVVGKPETGIDVKDVPYIQDSNKRLAALQELCNRYKGTPHAEKISVVYEKTKHIHSYLGGRRRVHELELFHLQHTDHFLNTFTVIMDAHQQLLTEANTSSGSAGRADMKARRVVAAPFRRDRKEVKAAEMLNREISQRAFIDIKEAKTEVPRLSEPSISINTYSKIVYLKEDISDGLTTNEIGFTSTAEEKETFVNYVSSCLGIEGISYVGNAMVYVPTHSSAQPAEMVPLIHWNGCPYALILEDFRLFPVKTYRKSR